MSALIDRIVMNAEATMEQYSSANMLLSDAMKEAMPWAMSLVTSKKTPTLPQLERLATQIVAILMASQKEGK